MGLIWSYFFPPAPELTEANLPRQDGKVFIVTGGASGVGYELCRMLYQAGGKVYLVGRSEDRARTAVEAIKALPSAGSSPGELELLVVALHDFATIKPGVETFLKRESRLDCLFNNAGVSSPPKGSVDAQGHDLTLSSNCYGAYLLTQLLVPIITATAKKTSPAATRVIWTSSIVTDLKSPQGGIKPADITNTPSHPQICYEISKVGNWFLADALAKQIGGDGVLSVTINPGNLQTPLLRNLPRWLTFIMAPLLHEAKMGAYTALWAGLSSKLTIADNGGFVLPWGRSHPAPRQDILEAMKTTEEGGTGIGARFVEDCNEKTAAFR